LPGEDDEYAQTFVTREPVIGSRRDEGGGPLLNRQRLALDREHPAPFEDDVELVVLVRGLVVGLGRNEDVDPDL
jgi:hypothetical protein